MKSKHRKILSELSSICNSLGADLDYTATHESKLRDRQKAHMLVSHVLYGVLVDSPENDYAEDDMKKALESLDELKKLTIKTYTDRNGFLKPEEITTNPLKQ